MGRRGSKGRGKARDVGKQSSEVPSVDEAVPSPVNVSEASSVPRVTREVPEADGDGHRLEQEAAAIAEPSQSSSPEVTDEMIEKDGVGDRPAMGDSVEQEAAVPEEGWESPTMPEEARTAPDAGSTVQTPEQDYSEEKCMDVQEGQTSNPHDSDERAAAEGTAHQHIGTPSSLPEEADTAHSNGNYEADLEQHHVTPEENAECKNGVQVAEDSVVQEVAVAGAKSHAFLAEAPSSLLEATDTAPSSENRQEEGARYEDVLQAAEDSAVQEVAAAGNNSPPSTSFAKKTLGSITGTLRTIGKKPSSDGIVTGINFLPHDQDTKQSNRGTPSLEAAKRGAGNLGKNFSSVFSRAAGGVATASASFGISRASRSPDSASTVQLPEHDSEDKHVNVQEGTALNQDDSDKCSAAEIIADQNIATPLSSPGATDTAPSSGNHQEEGAPCEDGLHAAEDSVLQEVATAGSNSPPSTSFAKKAFGSITGNLRTSGKKPSSDLLSDEQDTKQSNRRSPSVEAAKRSWGNLSNNLSSAVSRAAGGVSTAKASFSISKASKAPDSGSTVQTPEQGYSQEEREIPNQHDLDKCAVAETIMDQNTAAIASLPEVEQQHPEGENAEVARGEGVPCEDCDQAAVVSVVHEVPAAGNDSPPSASFATKAFGSITGSLRMISRKPPGDGGVTATPFLSEDQDTKQSNRGSPSLEAAKRGAGNLGKNLSSVASRAAGGVSAAKASLGISKAAPSVGTGVEKVGNSVSTGFGVMRRFSVEVMTELKLPKYFSGSTGESTFDPAVPLDMVERYRQVFGTDPCCSEVKTPEQQNLSSATLDQIGDSMTSAPDSEPSGTDLQAAQPDSDPSTSELPAQCSDSEPSKVKRKKKRTTTSVFRSDSELPSESESEPSVSELPAEQAESVPSGTKVLAGTNSRLGELGYTLMSTLGTGSFSRVKLATHVSGAVVAVKILKKAEVIRLKQADHVRSEKAVLEKVNHPFLYKKFGHDQDDCHLYLILEFVQGGEFFTHLRKAKNFSEESTKFYAACTTCALGYLHSQQIVLRSLKPEDIMVGLDGYIKLIDYGFAKELAPGSRTYTLCGTAEYLAPEVLLNKGHSFPVDWWTLGILTYEMAVGYPPFGGPDPMGIYQKILQGLIVFPKHMSAKLRKFLKDVITADLSKRLGANGGVFEIASAEWFKQFDWKELLLKNIASPAVFTVATPTDTSNFEDYPDSIGMASPVGSSSDPFLGSW